MSPTRKTRRSYQRPAGRSTRRLAPRLLMTALAAGLCAATSVLGLVSDRGGRTPAPDAAAPLQELGLPAADARFGVLGSEQCRVCHRALYEGWRSGPHANAASRLSSDQSFDPTCQPCHAPHTDDLEEAVGCEACHGPGSAYAELDVMIDSYKSTAAGLADPAARCAACHNPGHPFHVERDLPAAALRIHPRSRASGGR